MFPVAVILVCGMKLLLLNFDSFGMFRVACKSRQPAKFAGFSARFRRLLSLLPESKYVEEMDPQPVYFSQNSGYLKT